MSVQPPQGLCKREIFADLAAPFVALVAFCQNFVHLALDWPSSRVTSRALVIPPHRTR